MSIDGELFNDLNSLIDRLNAENKELRRENKNLKEMVGDMLTVIQFNRHNPYSGCTRVCPHWKFMEDCQVLPNGECWFEHMVGEL